MNIQKVSKIVLAILLFLCLAPMPYGYFQLVRVLSMIAFAYFAYLEVIKKNEITGIIFIALAILFQPFIKIALGRFLWNIVDIVVGVGLLIYAFNSFNTNKDKK